jgi:tRNA-Thr(GGU) m(6)t(6)A37 methyltransferase TsaA
MSKELNVKVIAHIETLFKTKFGVPRQSGLVKKLPARIVMEPQYRTKDAFRGIEGYSHLWLIWEFSEAKKENWSATVRPPRLGGNTRMGVFATRSPYRPNPIGLSCVKLERIEYTENEGPVLHVTGADLMNNTPILDIKPYIPFADAVEGATSGFAGEQYSRSLEVNVDEKLLSRVDEDLRAPLLEILAQDPRPAYKDDPERVYGFEFADYEIKFKSDGETLTVVDIIV